MTIHIKGAGIAGACLYRAACDLGVEAIVHTDNRPNSSQIALATLHTEGWQAAADQYEAWGVPTERGAWASGYRRANPNPTWDTHWVAVDPVASLNIPTTTDPAPPGAIDCTANPGWGNVTWGATWINTDPTAMLPGLRIHHYAPYKTITGITWATDARFGSTIARTMEAAQEQATDHYDLATNLGWINPHDPGWTLHLATRVQSPPTHGRYGGFHRDGYTLAALHAHETIKAHA